MNAIRYNTRIAADVSPWVKQTLLMIYKPRRRHHDRVRKNYYSSFIEERPARARVFEPLVNSANPDRMNWSLQRHWWPHRLQDNLCRIPRFDPVKCSLREIRSILCAGVSESGHEAPKPSHRCDQPQNESNDDDFFETRHAAWTECITGRSSVHSPLVRTTLRYTVEYKRKIADPTLIS